MQTRIKRKLKLFLSLIYLLSLSSCFTEKRLEFCECIDLKAMITDEFTLSKNDKEAKQKACRWIENELSTLEITKNPNSYHFRLAPSIPMYTDMLLEEILKLHNIFQIKLSLSKSIKSSATITFELDFDV